MGNSLGQIGFDLANTTGNMAPAIGMGMAFGPGAAAATTFASAGGNAYGEALAQGYDKRSARAYGTLVGVSEAGLQYALGGISQLGGKVVNSNGIQAALNNIERAAFRIPAKFAVASLGEATEEYLQEILNPVFRNLALGEDNEFKLFTEDAAYSALLAVLSVDVLEGPNIVSTDADLNRMGQTLRGQWGNDTSGVVDILVQLGLNQERGTDAYQAAQAARKQLDHGHALTNVTLGSLYQKVMGSLQAEGAAIAAETGVDQQTVATPEEQGFLEGLKGEPKEGTVNPGARESVRETVGEMPSEGYDVPRISMPDDVMTGEDGVRVPESKLPSVIRKYMLKLFRGKVLDIGADNKVYISRDGIKEFSFPAKRIDGEIKGAKMTAGANLDTTLAPAEFLTNTPDDGRHPQATGGWDNFYVMFETDTGLYSGIVKTMVTDRGRVFYDIAEIQKEGGPTTHGDNGVIPPPARTETSQGGPITRGDNGVIPLPARTETPSMHSIPQPPGKVKLQSTPDTAAGLGFQQGLDPGAGRIAQMKATLQGGVEAAVPEPSSPLETRLRQERGMDQDSTQDPDVGMGTPFQSAEQYSRWLKDINAQTTTLDTVDKYREAEYNNSPEYQLLRGYAKAVEQGDISPLIGFDQFAEVDKEATRSIVGKATSTGVVIESAAPHCIARIIGQVSTPHSGMRQGISIEAVLDALQNPVKIGEIKICSDGDIRQTFQGKKAVVTISLRDKRLIQTNPTR